jgi:acetoin utilization deacetylase AcuC-like enzyme
VIPFVWSDAVLLPDPRYEIRMGRETPAAESPRRAEVIRAALAAGHPELPADAHDKEALTAVHEPGLLEWLREASQSRADGPGPELPAQDRVVPPLPPGAGDVERVEAVDRPAEAALLFRADALVVSLDLDAADDDPGTPLRVTETGYAGAGRLLAELQLPTVLIQEGGTHLPTLGSLVTDVLAGFAPWKK